MEGSGQETRGERSREAEPYNQSESRISLGRTIRDLSLTVWSFHLQLPSQSSRWEAANCTRCYLLASSFARTLMTHLSKADGAHFEIYIFILHTLQAS